MIYNDKLWQSINETNQESEYLQLCRSKTDCQNRIHCLLEAVCLTVNSTRPSPVTVYPLQVKFESMNNFQRPKLSLLYWLLGHKVPHFFYWPQSAPLIGHKVPHFFYWPQSALFLLLATKWPVWSQSGQCVCIVITSFIAFGHEVAHAFGVDITCTNTL